MLRKLNFASLTVNKGKSSFFGGNSTYRNDSVNFIKSTDNTSFGVVFQNESQPSPLPSFSSPYFDSHHIINTTENAPRYHV